MRLLLIIFAISFLANCSSSGVKPIGKDTYMSARTKSGYSSGGEALADLYEEAYAFCIQKGLQLVPLQEHSVDGIPGFRLASANIQFRCIPDTDPEVKRPMMHKEPDLLIENIQKN